MAAINFPDAPTNGQIFESGGMSWTYVAGIGWTLNSAIVEAGSGFTFIADTMPLPVNVGDTWFDSSTGASGGTSWVAVEEGPAGASEKVWVQFAPGVGAVAGPDVRCGVRCTWAGTGTNSAHIPWVINSNFGGWTGGNGPVICPPGGDGVYVASATLIYGGGTPPGNPAYTDLYIAGFRFAQIHTAAAAATVVGMATLSAGENVTVIMSPGGSTHANMTCFLNCYRIST